MNVLAPVNSAAQLERLAAAGQRGAAGKAGGGGQRGAAGKAGDAGGVGRMNVLAPVNSATQLERLAAAGVQEFYMGFMDEGWQARYGVYSGINRLTVFGGRANRTGIGSVEEMAKAAHRAGAKLYVTFNAPGYVSAQKRELEEWLEILCGFGIDGVITGVPDLVPVIGRHGLAAVASTMCGICNADIARFYADLGVKRMILPRELNLAEMAQIMKQVPEAEYEVFLMRNGCRYKDAACLGIHGGACGGICNSVKNGSCIYVPDQPAALESGYFEAVSGYGESGLLPLPAHSGGVREEAGEAGEAGLPQSALSAGGVPQKVLAMHEKFRLYHEYACGQCALWQLQQLRVAAVKIVGRMDEEEEIAADARLTVQNMRTAAESSSQEEYLWNMELPGDVNEYCREGLSCYYPEVCWG